MRSTWLLVSAFVGGLSLAIAPLVAVAAVGGAGQERIDAIEHRLFDPVLAAEQVDGFLADLEKPERREAAATELIGKGRGHIERIIAFARKSRDIEARELCANIVEALDAAYRRTDDGVALADLYRAQSERLLPDYWARFRKDVNDPRAVAMIMRADRERAYAWLGKQDALDPLRYLCLRLREDSPDEFAAAHLGEHTAVALRRAMGEVFPCRYHRDGPVLHYAAHRLVGQTLLKVLAFQAERELTDLQGSNFPKIQYVHTYKRWLYVCTAGDFGYRLELNDVLYLGGELTLKDARLGAGPKLAAPAMLPQFKIDRTLSGSANNLPWWLKTWLPAEYRRTLSFAPRPYDATGPEIVEPPADDAPLPELPPPVPVAVTAERRAEAAAELAKARKYSEATDGDRERTSALRLKHAAAAVQLDPSSAAAAFEQFDAFQDRLFRFRAKYLSSASIALALELALDYLQRHGEANAGQASTVLGHSSNLLRFANATFDDSDDDQRRRVFVEKREVIARLFDWSLAHNNHGYSYDHYVPFYTALHCGMQTGKRSQEEIDKEVDAVFARVSKAAAEIRKRGADDRHSDIHCLVRMFWRAIELTLIEGRDARARVLYQRALAEMDGLPATPSQATWMRGIVAQGNDKKWLAEFDEWARLAALRTVSLVSPEWPEVCVFPMPKYGPKHESLRVKVAEFCRAVRLSDGRVGLEPSVLLADGNLVYLLVGVEKHGDTIAVLELDEQGAPRGQAVELEVGGVRYPGWSGVEALPKCDMKQRQLSEICLVGGRLCVTRPDVPIHLFDRTAGAWSTFGKAEWKFDTVSPVDDDLLYVTCGNGPANHGTLDLRNGQFRWLHKSDPEKDLYYPPLLAVWHHNGQLRGFSQDALLSDLLGPKPVQTRLHDGRRNYGWEPEWWDDAEYGQLLTCGKRRFLCGRQGMHEVDTAGQVTRSWWAADHVRPNRAPHGVVAPATSPDLGFGHVVHDGLIYSQGNSETTAYDPETDTWYGPLLCEVCGGIHSTGIGLVRLRNEDFIAKARELGRVTTSAEYLRRRDKIIDALPLLDRAKVLFAMRKFEAAQPLLEQVLKQPPEIPNPPETRDNRDDPFGRPGEKPPQPQRPSSHVEALLLLGWLRDRWCLNKPDEALRYYAQLEAMKENRQARFSGVYMRFRTIYWSEKWPEVIELADKLCAEFPQIGEIDQRAIDHFRNYARKQLSGEAK